MPHNEQPYDEVETREEVSARHRDDEVPPNEQGEAGSAAGSIHAAGAPGGGSAIGGLAGTNIGDGSMQDVDVGIPEETDELDAAGGSGNFDVRLAKQDEPPYAGHAGGAVGGTPAEKRAEGGKTGGGIAPRSGRREAGTIGSDPTKGEE